MKGIEGEALTRVNLLARKALYKNSAYAYFSGGLTKEIKRYVLKKFQMLTIKPTFLQIWPLLYQVL